MSIKKGLKVFYNKLIVEKPEKDGIVKELCNLYNEERSKSKYSEQILDILDTFLAKKNQNPDNIINWCLNDKINPTVQ
ncbi:6574_t:CDS:1, partial [Scutellospora calospora]